MSVVVPLEIRTAVLQRGMQILHHDERLHRQSNLPPEARSRSIGLRCRSILKACSTRMLSVA